MAFTAILAGSLGYFLTINHWFIPDPDFVAMLPSGAVTGAITDGFTHIASYGAGFLGGLGLSIWAWRRRGQMDRFERAKLKTL
jgi:hypothetical protein